MRTFTASVMVAAAAVLGVSFTAAASGSPQSLFAHDGCVLPRKSRSLLPYLTIHKRLRQVPVKGSSAGLSRARIRKAAIGFLLPGSGLTASAFLPTATC